MCVKKENIMVMQMVGWVASALVFATFFMKTMIPLRTVAIASNLVFITYGLLGAFYGVFAEVFPILILHLALLPLNAYRLYQLRQLVRQIHEVSNAEESVEYLIPFMNRERHAAGEVLFRKGDPADKIYFIQKGTVSIPEIDKLLGQGTIFGEVGVFAAHTTRSASAVCTEACEIFSIHRDKVLELYYQNPRFGFFIVHALTRYSMENVESILQLQQRV